AVGEDVVAAVGEIQPVVHRDAAQVQLEVQGAQGVGPVVVGADPAHRGVCCRAGTQAGEGDGSGEKSQAAGSAILHYGFRSLAIYMSLYWGMKFVRELSRSSFRCLPSKPVKSRETACRCGVWRITSRPDAVVAASTARAAHLLCHCHRDRLNLSPPRASNAPARYVRYKGP